MNNVMSALNKIIWASVLATAFSSWPTFSTLILLVVRAQISSNAGTHHKKG